MAASVHAVLTRRLSLPILSAPASVCTVLVSGESTPPASVQVPRSTGSPPVPVMHSPPRAVSAKEQQDWKIPPCISNWKNAKGYTIPLDKRLAADGRGLQETAINDGFAKFTEALYVAEQNARQVQHSFLPHAKPLSDCLLETHDCGRVFRRLPWAVHHYVCVCSLLPPACEGGPVGSGWGLTV